MTGKNTTTATGRVTMVVVLWICHSAFRAGRSFRIQKERHCFGWVTLDLLDDKLHIDGPTIQETLPATYIAKTVQIVMVNRYNVQC